MEPGGNQGDGNQGDGSLGAHGDDFLVFIPATYIKYAQ